MILAVPSSAVCQVVVAHSDNICMGSSLVDFHLQPTVQLTCQLSFALPLFFHQGLFCSSLHTGPCAVLAMRTAAAAAAQLVLVAI